MAQTIIDFTAEQEKVIKAYKNWKLEGEGSKATTIKNMIDGLKVPEKFFKEE